MRITKCHFEDKVNEIYVSDRFEFYSFSRGFSLHSVVACLSQHI